jgi:hypothetical protein
MAPPILAGDGGPEQSRVSIESWITLDTAKDLFRRAGLDYPALESRRQQTGFKAVPMKGEHLKSPPILPSSI